MKRSHKLVIIITLQVLFLLGMIGFKMFTVYSGTPVVLKAMPVDPWDMFRGEYVRLTYDISRLEKGQIADNMKEGPVPGSMVVYVVLENNGRYWKAVSINQNKPELSGNQLFIKGRTVYYDQYQKAYHVTYGIEDYFVQEGEGPELERRESLDALVKIDRFGNAVLERIIK